MSRPLVLLATTASLGLLASPALAASPHFVSGPTVTTSANSLVVSAKVAGLGNVPTADFTLTGSVVVSAQCYTKSGNPVNGVPKTETDAIDMSGTFPARNGSTVPTFTVSPLSTLVCTGNQHVVAHGTYDLTLAGMGVSGEVTGSF